MGQREARLPSLPAPFLGQQTGRPSEGKQLAQGHTGVGGWAHGMLGAVVAPGAGRGRAGRHRRGDGQCVHAARPGAGTGDSLLVPLPFLPDTSPEPGSWDTGPEGAGRDIQGCVLWPLAIGLIAEALVAA